MKARVVSALSELLLACAAVWYRHWRKETPRHLCLETLDRFESVRSAGELIFAPLTRRAASSFGIPRGPEKPRALGQTLTERDE